MTKRLAIVVRKRARRLLRRPPCQDHKHNKASGVAQHEPDPGPSAPVCRFCLEEHNAAAEGDGNQLISPCACRGSIEFVHVACLREWVSTCNKRVGVASYKKPPAFSVACPVCLQRYRYVDQREDTQQPLSQTQHYVTTQHHDQRHHPSWHRPLQARERCLASILITILLAAGLALTHITDEYTAQHMQQAIASVSISTNKPNAKDASHAHNLLVRGLGFARAGWRVEEQVMLAVRCIERMLHNYVETNMDHTTHTLAPNNGHSTSAYAT